MNFKCNPLRNIRRPPLKNKDQEDDREVLSLRQLPTVKTPPGSTCQDPLGSKEQNCADILHNHARLVEETMAPESYGALSAPKPNIVVQTADRIDIELVA